MTLLFRLFQYKMLVYVCVNEHFRGGGGGGGGGVDISSVEG